MGNNWFKASARDLCCFAAGLLIAIGLSTYADDLRFEVAGGKCQHHLAPDSSWSYRDWGAYETNMNVKPGCYQLGVSWLPRWKGFGDTRLGVRIGYVDLGTVTADNTFPLDEPEYFRAKDTQTNINSATSRFNGRGGSRGFTMGPASEFKAGPLNIGPEAGVAFLYSRWQAYFPNKEEETYGCGVGWACADGWHATWYVGATARYQWLMLSVRQYENVHTSRASRNPAFIGPTTGPVNQVLVGLSIPL